jgi:Complex 1 protein (LYR family)
MTSPQLRYKVKYLYKEVDFLRMSLICQLLYLGRDYPLGYEDYFRPRLHAAFIKNKDITSDKEIEKCLKLGEYVKKGIPVEEY